MDVGRRQYEQKDRHGGWTWPVWMYVSVIGVIVYLMVCHTYGPPILR